MASPAPEPQFPAGPTEVGEALTGPNKIQHIFLDTRMMDTGNPIDWDGKVISVQWHDETALLQYRLFKKRSPRQHMLLVNTYIAQFNGDTPPTGKNKFVLRLPNLENITEKEDVDERVNYALRVFQQEHELRQRLHNDSKNVLPELLSDSSCDISGETNAPQVPKIASVWVEGKSLREWVTDRWSQDDSAGRQFHGIPDPQQWFDIAKLILRSLAMLHRERAAHGFICPDTIIIPKRLYDPREWDLRSPDNHVIFINAAGTQPVAYFQKSQWKEENAILPIRRWYDATENLYRLATESRQWARYDLDEGSDYYSATDIFSVGVTLAFLATGRDDAVSPYDYTVPHTSDGWEIVRGSQVRSRYHVMKAKLLDTLEQAARNRAKGQPQNKVAVYEDCLARVEVILQCSRSQLERRAQSTHHVLTLIEAFEPSRRTGTPGDSQWRNALRNGLQKATEENSHSDSESLDALVKDLLPGTPQSVRNLVRHRLSSALERVYSLRSSKDEDASRSLRVRGSRATIVDAFLGAMCALKAGDHCVALTTPDFWTHENFAPTSRSSSMLQLLRLRGVVVEWVIVLKPGHLYMPQVQTVLGFRSADDQRIEALVQGQPNPKESWKDSYFYCFADDDEYERVLRDKKSFVGLVNSNRVAKDRTEQGSVNEQLLQEERPLQVLIAPDFSSRGGSLAALTFWINPRRGKKLYADFYRFKQNSRPVKYFERVL